MGNESSLDNITDDINTTHNIILTWIPHYKAVNVNSDTYSLTLTSSEVRNNLWGLLRKKLIEEGKLNDVSWFLEDVLTKYENGQPVYDTMFIGSPNNDIIKSQKLISKNLIKIQAIEIYHE